MLCLRCAKDVSLQVSTICPECGSDLGDPKANRGFLPQLKDLEKQLLDGSTTGEEADERLALLEEAVAMMIAQLDKTRGQLQMTLDDLQQATFSAVLDPLRKALERMSSSVHGLPLEAPWPAPAWAILEQTQIKVAAGYRALTLLVQMAAQSGLQSGVDKATLVRTFEEGHARGTSEGQSLA